MLTIKQCRGARGILGWTQQNLADACGLSKTAINNFEKGHSDIKNDSLLAIQKSFSDAGIDFIGDNGIKQKSEHTHILHGENAFLTLFNDILDTVKSTNADLRISNYDLNFVMEHLSEAKMEQRNSVFTDNPVNQRFLCTSDNVHYPMKSREYRLLPDIAKTLAGITYIYGASKVAYCMPDMQSIVMINSTIIHNKEKVRFDAIWDEAMVLEPLTAS